MASSLASVRAFTKAVIDAKPWTKDPACVRMPWDTDAAALSGHGGGKGMCFAIMWDSGMVVPTPPVTRALKLAKKALELAGHIGEMRRQMLKTARPDRFYFASNRLGAAQAPGASNQYG